MKKLLSLFIVLLIFQATRAQLSYKTTASVGANTNVLVYDPIYFTVGTLSDYMGRFQYVNKENQIDRYFPYEQPLALYLTTFIKTKLNITVKNTLDKSDHGEMFSSELSKTLNSFYNEKSMLLSEKFETKAQILSFLAGVYYRYGKKLDSSIYKIQLTNSPKHQNCYEFLKRVGCENILYKHLKNIPAQFILYFEPTPELKTYFENIETERVIVSKSYHEQLRELMKSSREDFETTLKNMELTEAEKIKNAFKR